MHTVLGGYHLSSVKFVAAFDVDDKKVGLDLAAMILASENNTIKFADIERTLQLVETHPCLGRKTGIPCYGAK